MTSTSIAARDNVHTTDPLSSYAAAEGHEPARQKHVALILMYLERHPGLCASQYAEMCGLDAVETRRRLTDLKNRQKAYQAHTGRPTGRLECRWWPSESQGLLAL